MQARFTMASNPLPRIFIKAIAPVLALAASARADEKRPYFVTYDHHLEEPGSLEICFISKLGFPKQAGRFANASIQLEYGIRRWWATEFSVAGQSTWKDNTVFTGYQWENQIRPLLGEHWINPVLNIEFESIHGTDKISRDVVGRRKSEWSDELSGESEREIETKLVLSSNAGKWNLSENFFAVKNLNNEPWEFGYAMGASHPLPHSAPRQECRLCIESLRVGVEIYGGLGNWHTFGFSDTPHYIAPGLAVGLGNGLIFRVSPSFGLTGTSYPFLLGFGLSYEYPAMSSKIRHLVR